MHRSPPSPASHWRALVGPEVLRTMSARNRDIPNAGRGASSSSGSSQSAGRSSQPRLRCAIYAHKSTEEGLDQEFNSLDAQREACAAFITSQVGLGWKLLFGPL